MFILTTSFQITLERTVAFLEDRLGDCERMKHLLSDDATRASMEAEKDNSKLVAADTFMGVPISRGMSDFAVSVLYVKLPLVLDGETSLTLRKVYDSFRSKLPHLDVLEFSPHEEKAICCAFIFAINGGMSLMERFLDFVPLKKT